MREGGESRDVLCPPLLKDNNSYVGGVDQVDQMLRYYTCIKKKPSNAIGEFFFMRWKWQSTIPLLLSAIKGRVQKEGSDLPYALGLSWQRG